MAKNHTHILSEDANKVTARFTAFGLFLLVLMANIYAAKPAYNWDLIGYVATAISYTENSPEVIHSKTYETVKQVVPQETFSLLTDLDPQVDRMSQRFSPTDLIHRAHALRTTSYRAAIATTPTFLVQQIPLYSVKPIYPALMWTLNAAGVDLVTASVIISKASYFGIGILIFVWLSAYLSPLLSFGGAALLSSVVYLVRLSINSSPDALSSLFILAAMYLLVERKHAKGALVLLVISVGVRPDNILLLAPTALYVAIFQRGNLGWATACGLAGAMVVYFAETVLSGAYSWPTHFYFSFVEVLHEPANFTSPLTFKDYLKIYVFRAIPAHLDLGVIVFVFLAAFSALLRFKLVGPRDIYFHILIVIVLYMIAHFLAFPGEKERLFVAAYMMILMILTRTGSDILTKEERRSPQLDRPGHDK